MIEPVYPLQGCALDALSRRHGPRCRAISAFYSPMIVSVSALSYESPTLTTDGSTPASASRSEWRVARYWRPRSVWWTSPSAPARPHRPCSSASRTSSVCIGGATRRSMMRRAYTSITKAT